jgi:hypothetical protein
MRVRRRVSFSDDVKVPTYGPEAAPDAGPLHFGRLSVKTGGGGGSSLLARALGPKSDSPRSGSLRCVVQAAAAAAAAEVALLEAEEADLRRSSSSSHGVTAGSPPGSPRKHMSEPAMSAPGPSALGEPRAKGLSSCLAVPFPQLVQ